MPDTKVKAPENIPVYIPDEEERDAQKKVLDDFTTGRNIIQKSYNQFNGWSLYDVIDDWTTRWNGYLPQSALNQNDPTRSQVFLNFTRNQIISFLAKAAMNPPKAKIAAVNKKTGIGDKRLSDVLEDLNKYSLNAENGPARFLEAALECTTKGTVIVYEGYARTEQKKKVPVRFNAVTGKIQYKEERVVIFDNCYQEVVPLEDFYIANPFQPDVQKQPFVIWRKLTTYNEAKNEFGHYGNFEFVKPGSYTITNEPTTFYRNRIFTELDKNQCEIVRYYNRLDNIHTVLVNGVVIYTGPFPFKDGKYPFAKTVFEPYGNDFFWGMGFAQKIMGEQDTQNNFINMMTDKTYGSLLPYGLSSDLDDIIEDNVLEANKIRKVGNINNWKFDTLPGVSSGEVGMFQLMLNLARDNSGNVSGAGDTYSPQGGKLPVRQVLLKQQEAMQKLGFSMNFLEDLERDRTELRVNHILQFYSIPKISKITGKDKKDINNLFYRTAELSGEKLSDGRVGNKVIKLVGEESETPDERQRIADELSVIEEMGELKNIPTEALAIDVNTFYDYNYSIQIVKNSSYERNEVLDQAVRHEYASWRLGVANIVPVDAVELIKWVDEAYDIDTDRFLPEEKQSATMSQGVQVPTMVSQATQPAELSPNKMAASSTVGSLKELTMG